MHSSESLSLEPMLMPILNSYYHKPVCTVLSPVQLPKENCQPQIQQGLYKIMGKKGQCFCFFPHRMLQKHTSFQNDSCDCLICEFMSALTVVTRKLCWVHRERRIRESSHLQQDEETSYLRQGLQQGELTWHQFEDNYKWWPVRQGTATVYLTRFHQRHWFCPVRPTPL